MKNPGSNRILRVVHESDAMANLRVRMRTERAKQAMVKRAQTVELVFAWMKTHRKLRKFFFRGLHQVNDWWKFEAAVANIVRMRTLRLQI